MPGIAATAPKSKAILWPSMIIMIISANRLQFFLASFLLLGFFFFLLIPPDDPQVNNLLTRTSSLQVPSYAVDDSDSGSEEPENSSTVVPSIFIEDLVTLPDDELLLLVRLPWPEFRLPHKQSLSCIFPFDSSLNRINEVAVQRSSVGSVEYLDGARAAIRCMNVSSMESSDTAAIAVVEEAQGQEAKLWLITSALEKKKKKKQWDYLVTDLWPTEEDIVLLAKGINLQQRKSVEVSALRCAFNNGEIETEVTISSQEIFRCNHPPDDVRLGLYGKPVSLRFHNQARVRVSSEDGDALNILPSVAYYRPYLAPAMANEPILELCACTMVHNSVKFLHEWLHYHSHLGVEHFFLYDNNSEDGLDSAIINGTLARFNVTRHPWPWTKTQEAGFSHCALRTRDLCTWTMFIDIDEFLFSPKWLELYSNQSPRPAAPAPLKQLLLNLTQTALNSSQQIVGQISFNCRDFGPSGQTRHPEQGVTQGYTCRLKAEERHKSIVRTEAVPKSLANRIHHFELTDPRYGSIRVDSDTAVINHYKFQAWSEFKNKFQRRVSAYVADWREAKNLGSKDRTPGLGFEEIKPKNWENSFCEVRDTALRDYYANLL